MTFSTRFIHTVACTSASFLVMPEQYPVVWICHNVSVIRQWTSGLVPPFVNNTAMSIFVQVFWVLVFCSLGYRPSSEISGSYGKSMLTFYLFFFWFYVFIFVLELHCWLWALSGRGKWGLTLWLLYMGYSLRWLFLLWSVGSVIVAHVSSCSAACGIFLD